MNEEIKPCPFCGNKSGAGEVELVKNTKTASALDRNIFKVTCWQCGAESGARDSEEYAIWQWNKRPYDYDMPAIVKKVQQLEKALVRCGRAINYACEYYLDFSAGAEVLAYINGYDDQEDLEPLLRQLEEKSCKQPE